jgi:signal transduction histidine kinase
MPLGKVSEEKEPGKRISVSVLHKGLLFLTVAVVLAGLFFFQMFQLTLRAERLATTEAELSDVVGLADQALVEFANNGEDLIFMLFSSKQKDQVDPEGFRSRTSKIFAELEPHLVRFPGTEKILAESKLFASNQYEVLKSLKSQAGAPRSLLENIQILRSFSPRIRDLSIRLQQGRAALDKERAFIYRTRQEQRVLRDQLKQQIIGGAIAAILFFIVTILAFLNDITERLKVLVRNAQHIPTGKALPSTVSGSDELAYLDHVLHEASAQLLKSAEHRKSLMEMVAHDLRSPLAASRMSLQLLLDSAETSGQRDAEKIKSVRDNLTKIITLVEDLLTIDKLEAGELTLNPDWLDIKETVDESIEVISSLAAIRNLTIVNDVSPEHVEADKLRIMQVLNNLLTNAVKFSHESGRVRICSEERPDQLKISVIDEGVGLNPQDHEKLFNKFFQADNQESTSGFGLGLAITKLIVEAHGGHVGMTSALREGSTFWFTLPMDKQLPDHTINGTNDIEKS